MAEGTVDNLNIQLSADADHAVKSLNNLASTLRSINTAFTKDISGMRKFSKEIGTLNSALKGLNNIKTPDLSKLSKAMKSLSETKTSGAKSTADDVKDIVNSLKGLGSVNFNESGITKLTNSLKRLAQVDMSAFDVSKFKQITESVSTLGNMPDVSSSVNRFVSSLSRLANAGTKTGQSANDILRLGQQTALSARELGSVGAINDDVNMFVQSIGRLATAGNKTAQTASGLSTLSKETIEFFKAMQNAPKVSQNTIAMTQALAQLATAGGRVGTATNSVTSAFEKLSKAGTSTMNALKKASSGIVSALQRITGAGKGVNGLTLSLGNLLKTAVGFNIGYGLLNFGKSMFELGSDVTEVENVVDVAFGGMAQSAYDFASTAQEQFGLSELSALKYSGILMSMFNASGVAQRDAAEMSTTLTGLAGDLASFYNIDQEDAFTKLRSALAGEVEPMRALGVDMTVASMEAYALSQGITESWQSMSQAEKVMLRYNYLMSVTSAQQNDFQRTQASFANQTRLLTLNLQQLAATLGQGLIAAVLPAVTALNKLFAVLQKAAVAVRNFFYVLTGYKGGGSSGIVNDITSIGDASSGLEDLGSSGSDAASGLGEAAKAAEELKNATLGIDELNIISPNEPTSTGGSGGSGSGGGTGVVGGTDLGLDDGLLDLGGKEPEEYVSPWAEAIRKAFLAEDWEELGEVIADGLNRGLQKVYDVISWDNVGPKITAFTTAFTQTFNSLVDNFDWDLLGRTIGAGINTAVNTVNQLIDGIDWTKLGKSFAIGFNGLVNEVNWFELGRLFGNKFMIAWDTLYGFVSKLKWDEVGKALANGLNGMVEEINLATVAKAISGLAVGILEALQNLFRDADWSAIGKEIVDGLKAVDWGGLAGGLFGAGLELIKGLLEAFGELPLPVQIAAGAVATFFGAFKVTSLISGAIGLITSSGGIIGALGSLVSFLGGPVTLAIMGVIAVGALIIANWEDISAAAKKLGKWIGEKFDEAVKAAKNAWADISNWFGDRWEDIRSALSSVPEQFRKWFSDARKNVENTFKSIGNWFRDRWQDIKNALSSVPETFRNWFQNAYKNVQNIWINIKKWFSDRWTDIKNVFSPVASTFSGWFRNAYTGVQNIWTNVSGWFSEKWRAIKNVFSDVQTFFRNGFQKAYDSVKSIWNGIGSYFKGIANNIISPIEKAVNGIIGGINWVLKKVGSKTRISTWSAPKFAKGSRGVPEDTLGVVNDQKGATYKELIVPPKGDPFVPKGRNVMLPLQKGTKIMPANQTKELMKSLKIPKFASGIGDFFGSAWNAVKNFTGDVFDYLTNPEDIVKIAIDKFASLTEFVEPWLSVAGGMINTVLSGIVDFIKGIFDGIVPKVEYNPSEGVEQWRQLAKYALQLEGQYTEANLDRLLMQMGTESSGNPNAINNWDINAKNGTPSKGLMQVIDPTFKAYARPGYDTDIWDPLSNILASIRYTVSRYGSLANGWQGHGYASGIGTINLSDLFGAIPKLANGGLVMPGQLFVANERGPELIGRYGNKTAVIPNDQVVTSVSSGVEKAVQRQNAEMNLLLRQILETNQRILAKDNSTNIDGKRANQLLDRARRNSGYTFRRTVNAT